MQRSDALVQCSGSTNFNFPESKRTWIKILFVMTDSLVRREALHVEVQEAHEREQQL